MAAPDIGNSHAIEWYLHHECHIMVNLYKANTTWREAMRICVVEYELTYPDPEDWTRYDGEL